MAFEITRLQASFEKHGVIVNLVPWRSASRLDRQGRSHVVLPELVRRLSDGENFRPCCSIRRTGVPVEIELAIKTRTSTRC